MGPAPDPVGFVPMERMAAVKGQMTPEEVRALLGGPALAQPAEESPLHRTGAQPGDVVWTYRHRRRGKFLMDREIVSYLHFRGGALYTSCRVRWEEGP
jgi:hypothetical protein